MVRLAVVTGSTESETDRDEVRRVFVSVLMEELLGRVGRIVFDPIKAGIVPNLVTSEPGVWLRQPVRNTRNYGAAKITRGHTSSHLPAGITRIYV